MGIAGQGSFHVIWRGKSVLALFLIRQALGFCDFKILSHGCRTCQRPDELDGGFCLC